MNHRVLPAVLALTAAFSFAASVALARNPHCAGGIQYVVQGLRDKEKGNAEDYLRQMNKAVDQLTQCAAEDPADHEAVGYLGWAYAELDSMGPAGKAFERAIAGLGDPSMKKKLDMVQNNRDSYWVRKFNDGIKAMQDAETAYPDFTKAANADEAPLKEEAAKKYDLALLELTRAKLLRPGSAATMRNLAICYAKMGRFDDAEIVLRNGMTEAAADTQVATLASALRNVRANKANLLLDKKDWAGAIGYFQELAKAEPSVADHQMGLGNAYFNRAGEAAADKKKGEFKLAGDAYAKAFALKSTDADLSFNAALAYQNAGELALAEPQWRATLGVQPDNVEAMSSLASTLADMQKYDDAIKTLHTAIEKKPENKTLYRQLGAVYGKAGNATKSTELLTVYLAMNSGTNAADAAGAAKLAKPGSPAANTLSSMGTPDQVIDWSADSRKLQTWVYRTKKQAFTFDAVNSLALVQKSDWASPVLAPKK